MRAGELAGKIRGFDNGTPLAILSASLLANLPLILAALDLAAADLEYAGRKGHVDRYIEKTKARKALRRAEED